MGKNTKRNVSRVSVTWPNGEQSDVCIYDPAGRADEEAAYARRMYRSSGAARVSAIACVEEASA